MLVPHGSNRSIALFLFISCSLTLHAVNPGGISSSVKRAGEPFVTKYEAKDYRGFNQNWGMVQDTLGQLYFANGDGILIYDGVRWKVVRLPNHEHVKSIAINGHDRIYVGCSGEFGYLEAQTNGGFEFRSLLGLLDSSKHNFGTVWSIECLDENVFFSTSHDLLHFDGDKIMVYDDVRYDGVHKIGGQIYVDIYKGGVKRWNGVDWEWLFKESTIPGRIYGIVEGSKGLPLYFTGQNGVFTHQEGAVQQIPGHWDQASATSYVECAILLKDGNVALGTANGLMLYDLHGQLVHRFQTDGLNQVGVHALFTAADGKLWAALDNGIAQINWPSAFRKFDRDGQFQRCLSVVKHQDQVYGGFATGLHRLATNRDGLLEFSLIKNINEKIWDLFSLEEELFIAAESGVFIYRHDQLHPYGLNPSAFLHSQINPDRILISQAEGISSLLRTGQDWKVEPRYDGVTGSTYTMLEQASGNIWLETAQNRIWKIEFDNVQDAFNRKNYSVKKYEASQGVTDRGDIFLYRDHVYYVTASTPLLKYDIQRDVFLPDSIVANQFGFPGENVLFQHIDDRENVFFLRGRENYYDPYIAWRRADGTYEVKPRMAPMLNNGYEFSINVIDSVLWLGYLEYLVAQDLFFTPMDRPALQVSIQEVIYLDDSLVVAGPHFKNTLKFPYKQNRFRFKYGATQYDANSLTEYQVRLAGLEEGWSEMTTETQKDYTNLDGGAYSLEVRARDVTGRLSELAAFDFLVLPPWYRTWWAYSLWILIGGAALYAAIRWREHKLAQENLALQAIIDERTSTLQDQKRALAQQAEQLKEMDAIKSRFFANISHEFRTPLTLIKGPIDQALKTSSKFIDGQGLKLIKKNADRLLQLVNQLLDLAKLDARGLELNLTEGNVLQMLRSAASSFNSMAAQREIDYKVQIPNHQIWMSFDHDKLEKIAYNLLSNAFKFTPDQGFVGIEVRHGHDVLTMAVSDSGIGISDSDQDRVFSRFYQVDDSDSRHYPGTGVGLALTHELVQLMGGTISISSKLNEGTLFTIQIPMEEIRGNRYVDAIAETNSTVDKSEISTEGPEPMADGHAPILLLVEDHLDMSAFLQKQLGLNYQMVTASSGKEGFEKAVQMIPDIILTDLMMPKMDGIEMTQLLKMDERTSHVPVIMLTAKAGTANIIVGMDAGADHYLTKPFELDELKARVASLINQRKRLQKYYAKGMTLRPKEIKKPTQEEAFMQKLQDLFELHHSDATFGVPGMLRELAMSKTQLHRKVKALTNHGPGELLRIFRIERAKQLLPLAKNVSEVAYDVGFNNPSYFAKVFKDLEGISPTEFIAK